MKTILVRKVLFIAGAGCFGLAGLVAPAQAGVFSATRAVIAIVDGELFVGQAEGHLDGSGTLAIHSQKNPALACQGAFTSSAALGGSGQLSCNDGSDAAFRFQRIDIYRGHGTGTTSRGAMSFVYGLTPDEASSHLLMPGGKKFSAPGTELTLVDQ